MQNDPQQHQHRGARRPVQEDVLGPIRQPLGAQRAPEVYAKPYAHHRGQRRQRALGVVNVREAPAQRRGLAAGLPRLVAVMAVRRVDGGGLARAAGGALRQPSRHPHAKVLLHGDGAEVVSSGIKLRREDVSSRIVPRLTRGRACPKRRRSKYPTAEHCGDSMAPRTSHATVKRVDAGSSAGPPAASSQP